MKKKFTLFFVSFLILHFQSCTWDTALKNRRHFNTQNNECTGVHAEPSATCMHIAWLTACTYNTVHIRYTCTYPAPKQGDLRVGGRHLAMSLSYINWKPLWNSYFNWIYALESHCLFTLTTDQQSNQSCILVEVFVYLQLTQTSPSWHWLESLILVSVL